MDMLKTRRNSDEIELKEINENSSEEEVVHCKEEHHPLSDIDTVTKTNFQWGKVLLRPFTRRLIIGVLIFLLFLGCFLFVVLPLTIREKENPFRCTGDATHLFEPNRGKLALCHRGFEKIRGRLGDGYLSVGDLQLEQTGVDKYEHDDIQLTLSYKEAPNNPEDGCLNVKWNGPSSQRIPLRDCYNISGATWFAGHTPYESSWPLNISIPLSPFLPNDSYNRTDNFGSVLHPVWLSTRGAAIFVDRRIPLHVSINLTTSWLCLQSLPYPLLCSPDAEQFTTLEYRVCGFVNVKDAAVHFLTGSDEISHPSRPPDINMFKYPIWSTWAKYRTGIDQTKLSTYLNDIISQGFRVSNLEIDDRYSTTYGTLDFDVTKFPNINNLTHSDHVINNSIAVTAWVHPFVDYKAPDFDEGLAQGVFYPGGLSRTEALVRWWNGVAAVINFEDEKARKWFRDRLIAFKNQFGIASFKFDAGEANYLPECLYYPSPEQNGSFTAQYAQFAADSSFGTPSRAEIRVGHFSQHLPIMVRMVDRDSTWSSDNGLHSVIITTLSMGMMGYRFVLPDMIGGNAYINGNISAIRTVDFELYVRWMQLVTFLPSMQFSITPWEYEQDSEVNNFSITEHARQLVDLHARIVDNCIYELANNTVFPIIRPLWWITPHDPKAVVINDQFLIGNDIMVAPVIKQGEVERKVYFPEGTWTSCLDQHSIQSEGEYVAFHVNLTTFLWFEKSPGSTGCCTSKLNLS